MKKKMAGRLFAAVLLSLAVSCQGGGDAQPASHLDTQGARASACVERFDGISHCATGAAQLSATAAGLAVSGLSAGAAGGVSSNFDGAVSWTQRTEQDLSDGQLRFSLAARDGDQVVSTLEAATGEAPNQLSLQPLFTGSPGGSGYRLNVYDGGVFQGGTDNPSSDLIIIVTDIFGFQYVYRDFDIYYRDLLPMPLAGAGNGLEGIQDGACRWKLGLGSGSFRVLVDGEELSGDQLELVELLEPGAYPYTSFSGIDATDEVKDYVILDESIRQGE